MLQGALIYLLFLPVVAGAPLLLERNDKVVRWLSLLATGAVFCTTLLLYFYSGSLQGIEGRWLIHVDRAWIDRYGVRFSLGLDGISLLLVTLTAFVFVLAVAVSWRAITTRVQLFHFMLLTMETGVMGVFLATDLFLFYLFWEVMLIPMFFLIGMWGHGRRVYSAVKFIIYTVAGSLLMLLAIIGLYVIHGGATGDYTFALDRLVGTPMPHTTAMWLFAAFLLGFAVKVPVFPLHLWLPDAHTDAPTAGSVILAGLLLKTGTYGLLRFAFPLFPGAAASFLPLIFAVSIVGIFYAAWIAFAQKDMKRLVAYSSIAHLGFVVLGIAAWNEASLAGSVLQMVNHGVTTGALFIMVGMLDERTHTRDISAYGGLWARAPALSAFFLLFVLSSLGLPGLNNFAGELLILVGVFRAHPVLAASAFAGLVAGLIYLLRLAQKLLFGQPRPDTEIKDLTPRELSVVVPLAALVLVIGLYPALLLKPLAGPVSDLAHIAVRHVDERASR